MQEVPNFDHITTSAMKFESHDKIFLLRNKI